MEKIEEEKKQSENEDAKDTQKLSDDNKNGGTEELDNVKQASEDS